MTALLLPTKDSLFKAMEVVGRSPEGAQYLCERFQQMLEKNRMSESSRDLLAELSEFAKMVDYQTASADRLWDGVPNNVSDFQNAQQRLGDEAAEQLKTLVSGELGLHIAVSDDAEFIRGYSADGEPLDSNEAQEYLDTLLNSWFAQDNMINRGSTLYEKGENSDIQLDAQGQPVKADVVRIRENLNDEHKSFDRYLQSKGLKITTHQQPFPKEEAAIDTKEQPQVAAEETQKPGIS